MAMFVVFLVNFFNVLFDSMKVERRSREEKIRNYLFIYLFLFNLFLGYKII